MIFMRYFDEHGCQSLDLRAQLISSPLKSGMGNTDSTDANKTTKVPTWVWIVIAVMAVAIIILAIFVIMQMNKVKKCQSALTQAGLATAASMAR